MLKISKLLFIIPLLTSCSIVDKAYRERMYQEYNSLSTDEKILYLNMQPDINHATRIQFLKYN